MVIELFGIRVPVHSLLTSAEGCESTCGFHEGREARALAAAPAFVEAS